MKNMTPVARDLREHGRGRNIPYTMQCSMPGWGRLVRPPCLLSVSNSPSVTLSSRNCRRNRVRRDYALPPARPKDRKATWLSAVICPGINLLARSPSGEKTPWCVVLVGQMLGSPQYFINAPQGVLRVGEEGTDLPRDIFTGDGSFDGSAAGVAENYHHLVPRTAAPYSRLLT